LGCTWETGERWESECSLDVVCKFLIYLGVSLSLTASDSHRNRAPAWLFDYLIWSMDLGGIKRCNRY
jgi:hypothetical protein